MSQFIPEEVQQAVIAAYNEGRKLRTIEEAFGLTRSQVYWVLQQSESAPIRTKPKSRLEDGDERTIVRLYEVVEAQDQRIQQLEAFIRDNGLDVPDHPAGQT